MIFQVPFKLLAVLLISFAVTAIFLLPFCDLMYKCGCKPFWAGAVDYCNINVAGVPHCPWCEARNPVLMVLPFVLVFLGQGLSIYHFYKKRSLGFFGLLLVGLLAFIVLAVVHGYVFKVLDRYPYFFR